MSDRIDAPDISERNRALDPSESFIVQAPAGSGKTELLIQRYLALLAIVERPEEIAAITFTIKAAAEMRKRVFEALHAARSGERPATPHEARTWDLARAALARNDVQGWELEESADRLRVQTIDALCASLTRQMPVLSRFGAQPEPIEDASALYREAARRVLRWIEVPDRREAADVTQLLRHLDNDALAAETLLATMLEKRDHWIRTVMRAPGRQALEAALQEVRVAAAERARRLWPENVQAPTTDDVDRWIAHADAYLTKKGDWRANTAASLRENEPLRLALKALQRLPLPAYEDRQWETLEAIVRLAPRAVIELKRVFALHAKADFIEIAQGAVAALGNEDEPTDLLLALDYRIRHVLVDEFQDTSYSQFELLQRLTSGWQRGDGRTLFLVGDPMQSIYRFRNAEVGLFLRAWESGVGQVQLGTLTLSANFRSQAGIVDWVNRTFAAVMPPVEDAHTGAVKYVSSQAVHSAEAQAVRIHSFFGGDALGEARRVAEIASTALASPGTVAILVRNRNHLEAILPQLREARLPYRAIEIEPLGRRPVVQDLLALARALSHLADRVAWLAVLRAPWCGLTLADLLVLAMPQEGLTLWDAMHEEARIAALSADGRARLAHVREVLERSLAGRRRSSLRAAVEGAWLALGGPACVPDDTDLEDAEIFLDHLEAFEKGGALGDADAFEQSLAKLFALPDLAASDRLQVMTIHNAKGLEFDTVIVPGLAGRAKRDDRELFLWMETPRRQLLLAPLDPADSEGDPIYKFVRRLDLEKAHHESLRLLYVACTRARRELHLLGDVSVDLASGEVKPPARDCLLAELWQVVAGEFRPPDANPRAAAQRPAVSTRGSLRRLESVPLDFAAPAAVAWNAPPQPSADEPIEFSWVGDTARRVGSVVHRWMQRIAEEGLDDWLPLRLAQERAAILRQLAAHGVGESEAASAADRVLAALVNAVDDERGRWVLRSRPGARSEYRISGVIDGVRRRLVIDRTFEEGNGIWIVDYKTSSHEGAGLQRFLAEEEKRYREQLDRYALALGRPDAVRGLYFPLLKGWREWGGASAPSPERGRAR